MAEATLGTIELRFGSAGRKGRGAKTTTADKAVLFKPWFSPGTSVPRVLPLGHLSGPTSGIPGREYWRTLSRVRELRDEPESNEDLPAKPTDTAFEMSVRLLRTAAQLLHEDFPRGSASVGNDGGVRVTWSRGESTEVRLICGGTTENRSYLYFESNGDYGVDEEMTGMRLASYLKWLVTDS